MKQMVEANEGAACHIFRTGVQQAAERALVRGVDKVYPAEEKRSAGAIFVDSGLCAQVGREEVVR